MKKRIKILSLSCLCGIIAMFTAVFIDIYIRHKTVMETNNNLINFVCFLICVGTIPILLSRSIKSDDYTTQISCGFTIGFFTTAGMFTIYYSWANLFLLSSCIGCILGITILVTFIMLNQRKTM